MSKGKLLENPLFYIYKILFDDGSTYIGSHVQWKDSDNYICSSRYYKRHPELKILKREILFYLPSLEQMNIMETIAIIDDKCYSPKNVNGNYGNYLYNFHSKLDCPWNKGLKMSKEFSETLSKSNSQPFICIETGEVFNNAQFKNGGHITECLRGERKTVGGKHFRRISSKEKENILNGNLSETNELNKNYLIETNADKTYYYCLEYNVAWECLDTLSSMLKVNPSVLKKTFGENYRGYTIVEKDSNFIFNNNVPVLPKLEAPKWSSKKVLCVETGITYNSIKEAMLKTGGSHIGQCLNGDRETSGGFHWELSQ